MIEGPDQSIKDPRSVLVYRTTEPDKNAHIDNSKTKTDSSLTNFSSELDIDDDKVKKNIPDWLNVAPISNESFEEKKETSSAEKLKWAALNLGPVASAIVHTYAGLNDLWFFKNFEDSPIRKFVDACALNFSKIVLTLSCTINGWEAIKKNRLWEAISRFIEPIFIIAEHRTEDLGLARGIGLGISQLVGSQEGIYNELAKQELGYDLTNKDETRKPSMGQDHDMNTKAFMKLITEIFKGGLGKNRRFLTGLTLDNMREKLSGFFKEFNFSSLKDFFKKGKDLVSRYENFCNDSGIHHIQEMCKGDENKDKGHTTALSGYTMILGSILGYMGKANKGLLYKIGGTLRNFGGVMADVSIFGHKDPYFNASALFLSVNTFMDIVQRFIPPTLKQIILPWSNLSMAAYNIGCGLYLNRSDMKSNQQDKVKTYDTDLTQAKPYQERIPRKSAELLALAS